MKPCIFLCCRRYFFTTTPRGKSSLVLCSTAILHTKYFCLTVSISHTQMLTFCRFPSRRIIPSLSGPSDPSAPWKCLLNRGRGKLGLLSARNMLPGAGMMKAFVTGPGEIKQFSALKCITLAMLDCYPNGRLTIPLWLTVRRHCLLWMSQTQTVSSWDPDINMLPSSETERHVTWSL